MKYITGKIFAGLLLLGAASCTANFENINQDPYQPNDKEMSADGYLLSSYMNTLAGCVISSDVNSTQFAECLLGGTQGGYFADANGGWQNTISNYNATDNWTCVLMTDKFYIPNLFTNLNSVKIVSESTNNPVPYAIALIMKVACMDRIADTFGPIPYSQIGVSGSIVAPYDSLDKVYDGFFMDLATAIETLTANQQSNLSPTTDFVYGGNVVEWIKFANSLKLRLAMRIAYADPVKARGMAEEAVSNEVGVMTVNADNAMWNYFTGLIQNPIQVAVAYNHVGDRLTGDTHAAADIICYMNGYNDPRREKYFIPSVWPGIDYVGLRRGISPIPDQAKVGYQYSGPLIQTTDPLLWMNASEVYFLRAEGAAVFGWNMGGSAEEFYNEGIRLSFERWGVAGADAYLADNTSKPQQYVDPDNGANSADANSQVSSITIKWDDSATPEQKQERIITQKWIANWPLGNEAWADYRRTGYPVLLPATAAGNKSGGIVDSKLGARRMPYPQNERTTNPDNYNAAVSQYLNGPDNMATRLWWDCKNQ